MAPAPVDRYRFEHVAMGTSWSIVLYAADAVQAERAARAGFAIVDEIERVASDYDASSELSLLAADRQCAEPEGVVVSGLLFELLAEAVRFAEQTDGAFDPTLGESTRLWRRARRQAELPSDQRIADALAATGYEALELDAERRSVRLEREGMRLDLGGIAKGQALDRALAAVRAVGVESALIEGGGDLRAGASPPGADCWSIAIAGVPDRIGLVNAGMATSGDAFRGFELDGVRYSHLIDPRTGRASTGSRTATVIAATAAEADAFASAACVSTPSDAERWFGRDAGRAARIASAAERDAWESPCWSFQRIADAGALSP